MLFEDHELDEVASILAESVHSTLNLPLSDRPFTGNEEKIFLTALRARVGKGQIDSNRGPIRFSEVFRFSPEERIHTESNRPLSISSIKQALHRKKSLLKWWFAIRGSANLIHYAAHLREAEFRIPNLTDELIRLPRVANSMLRDQLNKNLMDRGLGGPSAKLISAFLPSSHLEYYRFFSNHPLAKLSVNCICTSVYGLMYDPVISFMAKNNQSKLVYVQHGGDYNLTESLENQVEAQGASEMLYWGTGEKNIFPTRYPEIPNESRIADKILILLSSSATEDDVHYFMRLKKKLMSSFDAEVSVRLHPRSDLKYNDLKTGVNHFEHHSASLVIYDNVIHSLKYARILMRRPFLIVSCQVPTPLHSNARYYLRLLRDCGVLYSNDDFFQSFSLPTHSMLEDFASSIARRLNPLFDYFHSLPRLEDLY